MNPVTPPPHAQEGQKVTINTRGHRADPWSPEASPGATAQGALNHTSFESSLTWSQPGKRPITDKRGLMTSFDVTVVLLNI